MNFFKATLRFGIFCIGPFLHLYWFLFRPNTYGAVAVITNPKGEVLLIKQSYGVNSWKLSGGGIKKGERPEDAVMREVKEEVGLIVKDPKFLHMFLNKNEYKNDHVWVFEVRSGEQIPQVDNVEVIEARWFSIDDLPGPLSPIASEVFAVMRKDDTHYSPQPPY